VHPSSFSRTPNLVLKFARRGLSGTVRVWYRPSSGPREAGFGAIPDIGLDRGVRRFPIVKAEVRSGGRGYENLFGWIQVVAHLDHKGRIRNFDPDVFPMMAGQAVPYALFGFLPTLYDAPYWPERPRIHWRADSYLCSMVVRKPSREPIDPIAGFRWGFKIALPGGDPELLPLEVVGAREWSEASGLLRTAFPTWRFGSWRRGHRRPR